MAAGRGEAERGVPEGSGAGPPDLERVVFFSDAVLAIAITLLVLEVHVPELPYGASTGEQLQALLGQWPRYLSYVVSFWVIATYWTAHRRILQRARGVDAGLNLVNLLFLFSVAFLPFPTAVLGLYGPGRVPVVFYALWLTLVGLTTWLLRAYLLTHDPAVRAAGLVPWWRSRESAQSLVVAGVFLLSAVAALLLPPQTAVYAWPLLAVTPPLLRRVPSAYPAAA